MHWAASLTYWGQQFLTPRRDIYEKNERKVDVKMKKCDRGKKKERKHIAQT